MTDDCSDGALPDREISNNPEPDCFLPLDNKIVFAGLEGLEGLKVDNIKPQKDRFVLPVGYGVIVLGFQAYKTMSTSCRRFTQEQADYIGVKPLKDGHYRY